MRLLLILSMLAFWTRAEAEAVIENPDFKENAGGWKLSTMADEVFELSYDAGNSCVDLASTGTDYSGYLTQTVAVKPDTEYVLKVTLRHLRGRGLIWLTGYDAAKQPLAYDQRKYLVTSEGNPLVPHFVRKELLQGADGDRWRTEELKFTTALADGKPVSFVRISLGVYFSAARLQFRKVELVEVKP